jgi:hypothetical protein
MSKDNVKQMFGKMEKDAELQKKYAELMQAHQKETEKALTDKLVEFGKTSGFGFSKDDLLAARAELVDKLNSNKELSDGDLTNVAGGNASTKAMVGMVSVATIGTFCALAGVISIVTAAEGRSCSENISLTAECKKDIFTRK